MRRGGRSRDASCLPPPGRPWHAYLDARRCCHTSRSKRAPAAPPHARRRRARRYVRVWGAPVHAGALASHVCLNRLRPRGLVAPPAVMLARRRALWMRASDATCARRTNGGRSHHALLAGRVRTGTREPARLWGTRTCGLRTRKPVSPCTRTLSASVPRGTTPTMRLKETSASAL